MIDYKNEYTAKELHEAEDILAGVFRMYVNMPQGYTCKHGKDYERHVLFNPTTNHVQEWIYYETECYVDSGSDVQYNGHYKIDKEYTAL